LAHSVVECNGDIFKCKCYTACSLSTFNSQRWGLESLFRDLLLACIDFRHDLRLMSHLRYVVLYDPIQGQGHGASEVVKIALFYVYLLRHLQWELANDQ